MALRAVVVIACLALTQAKLINLSCKQVRAFVDAHNKWRLEVARGQVPDQPPASDMKYMVWDNELAAKAGKWAARNEFSHNPDSSIGSGRFTTGENLFWLWSTSSDATLDPAEAVKSWFDEHKDYSYGPLQASDFGSGPMIGHYTQVVWADSMYVGCAISKYWDKNRNNFMVVCNYGPGGNYIGQTPYKEAEEGPEKLECSAPDKFCRRPYGKRCRKL